MKKRRIKERKRNRCIKTVTEQLETVHNIEKQAKSNSSRF